MANITDIRVGASYVWIGNKTTPATKVKVVGVKGRWVRVAAEFNGAEMNVAAKDLNEVTTKAAPKAPRAKRVTSFVDGKCPECGSDEVYEGFAGEDGIVRHEDTARGCHACGWDNYTNLPKNGKVSAEARARYVRTKVDGVTVIDCGDKTAEALRGMEITEVAKFAAPTLGVTAKALLEQYAHLNAGMCKMSIANRLRKVLRDQEKAGK